MSLVVTLIANPSNPVLTEAEARKAANALNEQNIHWLSNNIACDIPLSHEQNCARAQFLARAALFGKPIDIIVHEQQTRRKDILLADMDSTMIEQECIDELADEMGVKDQVSRITARAMNGEIEFETALRERVALLKGLPVTVVDKVIEERITFTPGGLQLITTMKKNGAITALVSGGFTVFTSRIAKMLEFDVHHANILVEENGKLTGEVVEPILGSKAKVDTLVKICTSLERAPDDTIAVGDGANDLGMLQMAGVGIAHHAKPKVAKEAPHRVDFGDLTALLYIQGWKQDEF